jgi:hypothetical protein
MKLRIVVIQVLGVMKSVPSRGSVWSARQIMTREYTGDPTLPRDGTDFMTRGI